MTGLTMASTTGPSDGSQPQVGVPLVITLDFWRNWVKRDPSWVPQDESYDQIWSDTASAEAAFGPALDVEPPSRLAAFCADGGKILLWQGMADQLIFIGDSINLSNNLVADDGGLAQTQSWARYFLAPGVAHCGTPGADSIAPTDPMQSVVDWVDEGIVPTTLPASGTIDGQA